MAEALVSGRLGQDIGVVDNQKTWLMERAKTIEERAQAEVNRIRQAAREELFRELSSDQRKKAEEILWVYFDYQEPSLTQSMKQTMKKNLMQEMPVEKGDKRDRR